MMPAPNILLIMADQFRHDAIGCVNGWMKTPNLDRLCRSGTRFDNTFSNSLECVPARFSLATGLYPHQTGIWTNMGITLNPNFANWMQAVAAAGYRTSLFGKTHLHRNKHDLRLGLPLMHAYGFQTVSETTGPPGNARTLSDMTEAWEARGVWDAYKADAETRAAASHFQPHPSPLPFDLYYDVYVPQAAKQYLSDLSGDAPWFCCVSFGGPHPPYDVPEPYASLYKPREIPPSAPRMHDPEDTRGLLHGVFHSRRHSPDLSPAEVHAVRASYAGAITLIDGQIGELLAAIEARGELDNTLIFFTSDHGEMDGDQGLFGKANSLDPAAKIPLIVVPPGATRQASSTSVALVELMDIGATVADYAGADVPALSNARSLRSLLEGGTKDHRDFAVSEFEEYHIVVTPQWKAEFNQRHRATLLLDRQNDPGELNDLSRDPETKAVRAELTDLLETFLAQTPPREDVFRKKERKKRRN
jgi:choline-sulfatase